jgi:hypothetical protein
MKELISHTYPWRFDSDDMDEITELILDGKIPYLPQENYEIEDKIILDGFIKLKNECLNKDIDKRPSFQDILDSLKIILKGNFLFI